MMGSLRWSVCGVVIGLAVGCVGEAQPMPDELPIDAGPEMPLKVQFNPIELPKAEPLTSVVASDKIIIGKGPAQASGFRTLVRETQQLRGGQFALLVDEEGQPLERPTCGDADFGGLIDHEHGLFQVSTLDCQPGSIWVSRLGRSGAGALGVVDAKPVDLSSIHGAASLGRGTVTPWKTALIAGNGEANAARVDRAGMVRGEPVGDFFPEKLADYPVPRHGPYVYDHGWVVEVKIDAADGSATAEKRYAMGRFAHGIAKVMPDQRTVYLTDDTTNGGLFLFLADEAGDLSAGTLYVARFVQESADNGGSGKLYWANLGHATDEEIALQLESGTLHFEELFELQPEGEVGQGECLEGYGLVRDAWGVRCERPMRKHTNAIVHRLETRRSAHGARATLEFRDAGGIAHDPDHGVLYMTIGSIDRGMGERSVQWDLPDMDTMRIRENRCGGVYALDLTERPKDVDDRVMDSPYVATSLRGFILGRPDGYRCDPGAIANPSDVAYLPGSGTLLVAESTDAHANSLLWAVDVGALHSGGLASITPVLAAPPGGHVGGIGWYPDVGGQGYLTTAIMHPWKDQEEARLQPAEARVSSYNLWGPFPRLVAPEAADPAPGPEPAPPPR